MLRLSVSRYIHKDEKMEVNFCSTPDLKGQMVS